MLLFAEILIMVTNYFLDVRGLMMFLSSITMFFMVLGVVALGIDFGAAYPDFKHQNIAQVSTGFGGALYMMVTALFIAVIVVLEAGPVYILFISNVKGNPITTYQWLFIIVSFFAALVINVFAVVRPMRMGKRALQEYE